MCGIRMHARNYHGVIVCAMAGVAASQGTGEQLEDGELAEEPEVVAATTSTEATGAAVPP